MSKYIIRLDDACEKRDVEKWDKIENLLDNYSIKPIVGIIPNCKDPDMDQYSLDESFWERAISWQKKGWIIALHGFEHVFHTQEGGINPVNYYSEFAGVSLDKQKEKIRQGLEILNLHDLNAEVFFAPAHTFDNNTIEALKCCSKIRFISDTVANDLYVGSDGITYIPQQSGRVRKLPFKTVTFCYHPNNMNQAAFDELEKFLVKYRKNFSTLKLTESKRRLGLVDKFLQTLYFLRR